MAHSSGLSKDAKQAVQTDEHPGTSAQWTARTLRVKGQSVMVVVLYLAPGEGLSGASLIILTGVGVYIKAFGLLFVLVGDYNMTMGELDELLPPDDRWPELRRRARLQEARQVDLEDVSQALRSFGARVGQGGEKVNPRWWLQLPEEGLHKLARLLETIE